ncbi:MAG: hypothetical protein EOO68_00600 [Moraxellaceae bacterium]|nr:MAG: hypothetical protein EOO68_00600 [Moraxellaceae bacterium]
MSISDKSGAGKKLLALAPKINSPESNFVLMDCGDFSFLLPGNEIVSLLSVQQIVALPQSVHDCGYAEFEKSTYPVFSFNKAMQLQTSLKDAHNAIVLLHHRDANFAVSCMSVQKIDDVNNTSASSEAGSATPLIFFEVPVCMRSRKQPFTEFAIINNRAVGLTSASALFTLLRLRGAKLQMQKHAAASALQGAR